MKNSIRTRIPQNVWSYSGGDWTVVIGVNGNRAVIENEEEIDASDQLDLPIIEIDKIRKSPSLPDGPGTYLVYLDVWERHITALDHSYSLYKSERLQR